MRITNSMTHRLVLESLQKSYAQLSLYQRQVSSGKRINLPSDDPVGTFHVFSLSKSLAELRQYQANIKTALDEMNALSLVQNRLTERLYTIKEITTRASSGLNDLATLQSFVRVVESILKEIIGFANTVVNNKYMFSGFQTNTPAFTPVYDPVTGFITSVTYNGDTGQRKIQVASGHIQTVNLVGAGNATVNGMFVKDATVPVPLSIFDILIQLRNFLSAGDYSSIMSISGPRLGEYFNYLQSLTAKTGSEIQGLLLLQDSQASEILFKNNLRAEIEEVDALQAMSRLSNQQVAYQAALNVASRLNRLTLFDFLT